MTNASAFDRAKLSELVVYIANKLADDTSLGAVKLNKILWYCDIQAFVLYGKAITNATYVRKPLGPVARELMPVENALVTDESIVVVRQPSAAGTFQRRPIAQREAVLDGFEPREIALIDSNIEGFRNATGTLLSRLAHTHACWYLAKPDQEIPYYAGFLTDGLATEADIARGLELAREYGWFTPAA